MSFRLLRVKRRIDQDPAPALYFPIEESKRVKSSNYEDDEKEFRLFKIMDRKSEIEEYSNRNKTTAECSPRVILLSKTNDTSTVGDAILIDDSHPKHSKSDLRTSNPFNSFNLNEDSNQEFVYDMYRLDLGKFTSKEIETHSNFVALIPYEQEFLSDEEGEESDLFEDDQDSNAEDHYANDYPDEASYYSDEMENCEFSDLEINGEFLESDFEFDDRDQLDETCSLGSFDISKYDDFDSESGNSSELESHFVYSEFIDEE